MNSDIRQHATDSQLWPIGTFVGWLVCFAVGLAGLRIAYPGPRTAENQQESPPTQIVNVQLTPQPTPPPEPQPPPTPQAAAPSADPPAPAPPALNLPERPPIVAVAPPSPAISFALPTESLTHIVDASQAGYTRTPMVGTAPAAGGTGPPGSAPPPPKPVTSAGAPVIRRLTYEEGEGRQPKPEYPREAVLAGQQGTVGVRFAVGEDGRVLSVEVTSPSRWPLLNQSAKRTVQDKWRFDPGPPRIFDYSFDFHINH